MFSETSFPHMHADSLQLCYQQHRRPTLKGHAAEHPPPPDHPLMLGGPPCRSPVLCAARKKQQLSQNPIKDLDGSTPLPGAGSPTRVQAAWEGREGPICSCCRARSWLQPSGRSQRVNASPSWAGRWGRCPWKHSRGEQDLDSAPNTCTE